MAKAAVKIEKKVPIPRINKRTRYRFAGHGALSEKRTAERLGARLNFRSGAIPGNRGDMVLGKFRIEAKCTIKDSIRVELNWLAAISHYAVHTGKTPALTVTFVTKDGKPRPDGTWVMVPENVFRDLLDVTGPLPHAVKSEC